MSANQLTRSELRLRTGDVRQLARIDRLAHEDGPARGARLVRMVTGGGLELELHPDRCLDVGRVTIDGTPVAWAAPAATHAPGLVEHHGLEWRRAFAGGFLVTCGLDQFGSPSEDEGERFGMHGRASALPAEQLNTHADWISDDHYALRCTATMRQATLFGENLVLRREVASRLGAAEFSLTDTVTNEDTAATPHMMLYHMNLGWPLIDDGTTFEIPSRDVRDRDGQSVAPEVWQTMGAPAADVDEEVFVHHLDAGTRSITVRNADRGIAATIEIDATTMPYVFMWRMRLNGVYVVGIEPANTSEINGRAAARQAGVLPSLAPDESRTYRMRASFSTNG